MRIYRRIKRRSPPKPIQPAFDLAEIRVMLDTGKITKTEHDRLRDIFLKQRSIVGSSNSSEERGFEVLPPQ